MKKLLIIAAVFAGLATFSMADQECYTECYDNGDGSQSCSTQCYDI